MRKHRIVYGNTRIAFTLTQSRRTTLEISVLPDMSVEVKAPEKAAISEIKARVLKRGRWIVKKQRYFETFLPIQPARTYRAGETHRYLGRQYRLKIEKSPGRNVKLTRGYLLVCLPNTRDKDQLKKLVQNWFKLRAAEVLRKRFEYRLQNNRLGLKSPPELVIRKLKSRWGSCTPEGKIILNSELIHASCSCIDYVILHELCHLSEHNHSKRFYLLLERELPDWRKLQNKLNAGN